jgi:hypothetical protein
MNREELIGKEVLVPPTKQVSKIKKIKTLDSGKEIVYLESGAVVALEILRDTKGNYVI